MSLGMLLLVLVVLAGLAVTVPTVLNFVNNASNRREVRGTAARERIATKALRAIANGAGNPVYEAQDALDQMEGTYPKELN